jgi:hypothetical protein
MMLLSGLWNSSELLRNGVEAADDLYDGRISLPKQEYCCGESVVPAWQGKRKYANLQKTRTHHYVQLSEELWGGSLYA